MGRTIGNRNNNAASRGYAYLHHAIDDHSRLVYSEILTDQRKDTAAAFWLRANAWFADAGITVKAVMTDNGSCYRSTTFQEALGPLKHRRTKPYRPQTNGKVERFNRTLAAEWAYAATYLDDPTRAATYPAWLHSYNHHPTPHRHRRPHPRSPRSQPHGELHLGHRQCRRSGMGARTTQTFR